MTKEDLDEAWQVLSEREKIIISHRYGFEGEPETLKEVGKRIGVSIERVRNLQSIAFSKLRQASRQLEQFGEVRLLPPPKDNGAAIQVTPTRRKKKRVKKAKRPVEVPAPEQTDAVRLDYLEAEIKDRSLYIEWGKFNGWKLKHNNLDLYATTLRKLIDKAFAKKLKE